MLGQLNPQAAGEFIERETLAHESANATPGTKVTAAVMAPPNRTFFNIAAFSSC
jgi:hypothetical protein